MWEETLCERKTICSETEPVRVPDQPRVLSRQASRSCPCRGEGTYAVQFGPKGLDVTRCEFAPSAVAKAQKLAALHGVKPTVHSVLTCSSGTGPTTALIITLGLFFQFVGPQNENILWRNMLNATRPRRMILIHEYTPKHSNLAQRGHPTRPTCPQGESFGTVFKGLRGACFCEEYEKLRATAWIRKHVGQLSCIDRFRRAQASVKTPIRSNIVPVK